MNQMKNKEALAAAGQSFGIAAPEVPRAVLINPHIAKALKKVQNARQAVIEDCLVACKVKHLVVDLLSKEDWTTLLSTEQVKLVKRLQEAETDLISAH